MKFDLIALAVAFITALSTFGFSIRKFRAAKDNDLWIAWWFAVAGWGALLFLNTLGLLEYGK